MTTNPYATLANSNGTINKRFRVLLQDFAEPRPKRQTVRDTATGAVDVTQGPVARLFTYLLKVYHTESDSNYGSLEQLATLHGYNNPNGTPTDVLTLTTPTGEVHSVYWLAAGDFDPRPQTPMLTGTNAWFTVAAIFRKTT